MAAGCFRNFFATVGCLTVLAVLAIGGWTFRDQLGGLYRSVVGVPAAVSSDTTVGRPSAEALRAAQRKEDEIARSAGPGYVHLSADELASLIKDRLQPAVRESVDSVRVVLSEDRVVLEGQMLLEIFGRDVLGPLADWLGSRQPLRMGGPAVVREPGIVAWECDEFVIRAFPFPPSAVPRLVNRMTGGSDGVFRIAVPATVGEIRVRADGVTLHKRAM
jgi:hypothetical protein